MNNEITNVLRYFDYPFDAKMLLRKKKSIKRELLQQDINWIEKRIAVLGGSTIDEVVDQLEIALLRWGIKAEFYKSEFGKYWEDAMFGNDTLNTFHPDIVYFYTNWRNINGFPKLTDTSDEVDGLVKKELERFAVMWEAVKNKYGCPIIQNNFERPDYRLLGNRDIWDYRGRSNFISKLNQELYSFAQKEDAFYINDIDYLAQEYGLSNWTDLISWNLYKYACAPNAIPYVAGSVANIIKSLYGKNKKLLALDLDNTIWGGIVGDDGVEGLNIGKEDPKGRVYYDFQKYCKELKSIGVVLAVDSKNDEENAIAGLNHPEGVLRKEDFVSIKANWEPKDQNLLQIADELALNPDSFVFVDDNPVEREIVKKQIPAVSVPEINQAEAYIHIMDQSGYFEVTTVSEEDVQKTEQYRARASAKALESTFASYDEYLNSLEMQAEITGFEPIVIQRVAQLTNKSNQFNLTTLRCNVEDIRLMQDDPNTICLCGRLIDKFADNGIVTVVAGEIQGKILHIRLWLMSCRVLKRGLENLMMNELMHIAAGRGVEEVRGYYYPTKKNGMVKKFYHEMGFMLEAEDDDGNSIWTMKTSEYSEQNTSIRILKISQ